jgi:hypothetical protein
MTETSWALETQKMGDTPIFSSSRRKPTSNMAEAAKAKYAKGGSAVLFPLMASIKRKFDLSKVKLCLCPRLEGGLEL